MTSLCTHAFYTLFTHNQAINKDIFYHKHISIIISINLQCYVDLSVCVGRTVNYLSDKFKFFVATIKVVSLHNVFEPPLHYF